MDFAPRSRTSPHISAHFVNGLRTAAEQFRAFEGLSRGGVSLRSANERHASTRFWGTEGAQLSGNDWVRRSVRRDDDPACHPGNHWRARVPAMSRSARHRHRPRRVGRCRRPRIGRSVRPAGNASPPDRRKDWVDHDRTTARRRSAPSHELRALTKRFPMIAKLMSCALALAVAHAIGFAGASRNLAAVRAASERFKDVKVAPKAMFRRPEACASYVDDGPRRPDMAMGVHYFRPDMLGISGRQPARRRHRNPHRLPQAGDPDLRTAGRRFAALVAVENLDSRRPGTRPGTGSRRASWACPMTRWRNEQRRPTRHQFAPHYDRHVWVHRENPIGVFAQFNPQVSCEHSKANHLASGRGTPHAAHSKR